jgi:uncharacterized membrane protein
MSVIGSAARCERLRYCRTYQLGLLLLRNSTVVRRSLILNLLLLIASPAVADQRSAPEPALTYRVVNVAPGDVLRVRSQPDASAPVIDNLSANATGIILTGVKQNVGQATWWQIIVKSADGNAGWVNSRFLAVAEPTAIGEIGFGLRCIGTEPFWSLEIANGQASFTTPEGERWLWKAHSWRDAAGHQPGQRFVIQLDSQNPGASGWAAVSRPQQFCSDGMSDLEYPYDLIVATPTSRVLGGCCARSPQ